MSIVSAHARRSPPLQRALQAAIDGGIHSVYQPIVDLKSRAVIGYEALARGPVDTPLASPAALFTAAHELGLTAELDRACLLAALRGAHAAQLQCPAALFVNVEPQAIESEHIALMLGRELARPLDVFFEVTERSLTARPAELLETVERLRAAGFGIALDDVGADRRSLALLPLLRPDVVKLDMSLIHAHPSRRSGEVMNGVCAYAESTGAIVLAEGIENEDHLIAARCMGASLAQGWHFGRPGPLPRGHHDHQATVTLGLHSRELPASPVSLVHQQRDLRVGRKDILLSVTRALEAQALDLGEHAVVAACFQHARHFTAQTRRRYERLGAQSSLTVALGEALADPPAPGVRGAALDPRDPLVKEWDVAVLGPHFAGALVARDLELGGADRDRQFEFVLTFDRQLVVDVTASLISRLGAAHAISTADRT